MQSLGMTMKEDLQCMQGGWLCKLVCECVCARIFVCVYTACVCLCWCVHVFVYVVCISVSCVVLHSVFMHTHSMENVFALCAYAYRHKYVRVYVCIFFVCACAYWCGWCLAGTKLLTFPTSEDISLYIRTYIWVCVSKKDVISLYLALNQWKCRAFYHVTLWGAFSTVNHDVFEPRLIDWGIWVAVCVHQWDLGERLWPCFIFNLFLCASPRKLKVQLCPLIQHYHTTAILVHCGAWLLTTYVRLM